MLGFSMGGMAIMLAFSGSNAFKYIAQKGDQNSYFVTIVANFYHFIFFQTLAIMMAIVCKTYNLVWLSALSFWLFSYAVLVGVAVAGQLLRTAQIFNASASMDDDDNTQS